MIDLKKRTMVLAVVLATAGAGTAYAQSPTDEVYAPDNEVADVVASGTPVPTPTPTPPAPTPTPQQGVLPETATSTPAPEATPAAAVEERQTPAPTATPATETQEAKAGDLPFTGFEAGFVALAGAALLGGGVAMRRMSHDRS